MSTTRNSSSFHVGDRVKIDFGQQKLTGVIVEDRGPIGVRGRRLFRVEIPMEPDEPLMVELPENEMEVAPLSDAAGKSLTAEKIIEYLTNGGLISMLRSNISGGRSQPRVWLCLDNLGNVTHTFVPERGLVGGQLVPFWALQDDKIFEPGRKSVVAFVESFGLSHQQAEQVVSQVGIAP